MADFPCCEAPAGRGDATPDPAMIERAIEAAAIAMCDMPRPTTCVVHMDEARKAVRAAAGVIVPATAEQIAAKIKAAMDGFTDRDAGLYHYPGLSGRAADTGR